MSDIMRPVPFQDLLLWMLEEKRNTGRIFGVDLEKAYRSGSHRLMTPFGCLIGSATGPAAGPHTQLAQNIVAAYVAGARFMELKTVQIMDGQALREAIAKPCINAADEGYNVEWSTELTVEEAQTEYIKAWFLCHVAMKELELAPTRDFAFNMSVGYTLEGIQSPKIDGFIEGLKNAAPTPVFQECRRTLEEQLEAFEHFTREDLDRISPAICTSLALSTMHGCPKDEIQSIVRYLLQEKQLDVLLKCNPTLLGYDEARRLVDALGFDYLSFDTHHFDQDLKYEEAVPMLEELLELAREEGRVFGVKLTNTFPVGIAHGELPGEEMYTSGRALLPLTVHVAKLLSATFGSRLPMAYSGGADALNLPRFVEAGILPVTVCTTLLKPGGYERLSQIAYLSQPFLQNEYTGPDADRIAALADHLMKEARNHKKYREDIVLRKTDSPLPLFDCFKAPCQDGGCPIGQNIPAYLQLTAAGRYAEAMAVIAKDNALPATLGEICYHPCTKRCNRVDYDQSIDIRGVKHVAVEQAMEEFIESIVRPQPNGKTVLVIGAGVQGLSAALYLARAGYAVKVAEKKDRAFGMLNNIKDQTGQSLHSMELDRRFIEAYGVEFHFNVTADQLPALAEGADLVISTTGREESIPGARLTVKNQQTRLQAVYAMAEAKKLALEILEEDDFAEYRLPLDEAAVYNKRGFLILPLETSREGERCLSCHDVCEICTEVCPNRANVAIAVPGFANVHQILHLDFACNECGNCTTFCPHAGRPYKDKVTLFGSAADFHDSANVGFYLHEEEVLVRYAEGGVETTTLDGIREEGLRTMAQTVARDYPWLLVETGGAL
ncbi:NAD(P)-binding protein [Clostridiaceae bacterium HFYG-1003]|nr:NAD(P)-binding protein [Clostridiaceae bacterium HFYG-1003]